MAANVGRICGAGLLKTTNSSCITQVIKNITLNYHIISIENMIIDSVLFPHKIFDLVN